MAVRYANLPAKFYDVAVIAAQALVEKGILDSFLSSLGSVGEELRFLLGETYIPWILVVLLLVWLWRRPKRW